MTDFEAAIDAAKEITTDGNSWRWQSVAVARALEEQLQEAIVELERMEESARYNEDDGASSWGIEMALRTLRERLGVQS